MPDSFALTIIFLALAAAIAAFVNGRSKDKCLAAFTGYSVTLEKKDGKKVWGKMRVESTGLELVYKTPHTDTDGHIETSYLLYKHEYNTIQAVICFYDDLDEKARKLRERELERTANPGFFRRLARRTQNLFNTIRDSAMEAINLLMGQAQRKVPGGAVLTSQTKHVSKIKQDLTGLMGTSFEPLLEAYIGKRVTLEMFRGDKKSEYSGLLKDYTAEFIEMVDVNYADDGGKSGRADIVVPRHSGVVRHASE